MTGYKNVPGEKKTRRFEVVYLALTSARAQEIIGLCGSGKAGGGRDTVNSYLQELAGSVDAALQQEVERQREIRLPKSNRP